MLVCAFVVRIQQKQGNRVSRNEAQFMIQHFDLVIVLPGFKVQWVLIYTPKNILYILNHKTIASFGTLSDTITEVWIK